MNFIYGRSLFGRAVYAGPLAGSGSKGDGSRETTHEYYPGQFTVIAYNKDGTKTAVFGSGAESNALSKLKFEITSTGCGTCQLTFRKLPDNADLDYMQRIDIHLFGDSQPWYSGYILTRPVDGTTETEFKFEGYGYYNKLDSILIFETYENTDVGAIARDIAQKAEKAQGLVFNATKIPNVGYSPAKIVFDGVTAAEALDTLTDFALDYVYGVDEYRSIYFKPRDTSVNEQARLTVGKHVGSYTPSWDASKVVNWARIKGGNIDDQGEQWLCTVEDTASQEEYGLRQEVWDLPSAYEVADAKRWGENQIARYKEPTKSAKLKNVLLEYPYPDGTFNVRHMSTDGQAEVRRLDGKTETFPITKITYTVSGADGIKADLELGEPVFSVDKYLLELERKAADLEQSQQTALKQLKGG